MAVERPTGGMSTCPALTCPGNRISLLLNGDAPVGTEAEVIVQLASDLHFTYTAS